MIKAYDYGKSMYDGWYCSFIENGILDKGNIEPFIDEIVLFYSNDQIARSLYGDDIATLFRTKDASGKYVDKYNDIFSPDNFYCKNLCSFYTQCLDRYGVYD